MSTEETLMATVKEEVKQLAERLEDDVTWDEVHYRLYVREKVAAGDRAVEEVRVTPHSEVKKRFHSSHK